MEIVLWELCRGLTVSVFLTVIGKAYNLTEPNGVWEPSADSEIE